MIRTYPYAIVQARTAYESRAANLLRGAKYQQFEVGGRVLSTGREFVGAEREELHANAVRAVARVGEWLHRYEEVAAYGIGMAQVFVHHVGADYAVGVDLRQVAEDMMARGKIEPLGEWYSGKPDK